MAKNNNPGRILKSTKATATLKGASGMWTLDEAMQAHRANAWPQPDLFQPISNSLRAKNYGGSSTGTYGVRFGGRASTPTQATFSGWIKRGNNSVASDYWIFGSNQYNTSTTIPPVLEVMFKGNNGGANDHSLTVAVENLSISYYTSTSALFRDMSAWYHIYVVYDSTQSTNTNRIKIWINGVQLTAMSGSSWPPQGTVIGTQTPSLGCLYLNGAPTRFFDGYMAEINFIDGYALQPTLFGKFDTNNTWVPVPYTGSYGTNGFYLPFTNAATSQTLGYDASLTGTTTYDADQDPYRGSVALHLTGNGPAGGNNNTFADSGPNNLAITRQGSVITQGSLSPFPMPANTPYNPATNGASAWFNNTPGENLLVSASSVNAIGSGVFTLECWVYVRSGKSSVTGNSEHNIISQGNNASNLLWALRVATDGASIGWGFTGSAVTVTTPIPLNSWVHFAVTRDASNSEKIFVNGALVNTRTNTTNYNSVSSYQIQIGSSYDTNYPGAYGVNSYSNTLWGYISSTRLIIGSAVYTAAFVPPNKPFAALTTNLITFSEDFTNSTQYQITQLSNSAIAPDGTPTAWKITENTASGVEHYWEQSNFVTTNATYTQSIYIKPVSVPRGSFAFSPITVGTSPDVNNCAFNVSSTGVITTGSNQAGFTTTATSVGNGWYRITATYTTSGTITSHRMRIYTTPSSGVYTGAGVSSFYVWGSQLEAASSAGNYVPTPANFRTAPSLLLNFANAAVTDSTGANNITTVGAATITSASKYGSGALAFSGSTSNYFMTDPGSQFEPGSQDFTVEFWWYPISTGRQWFYHATTDYWFAVDYSSVSTNQKMGMWASSNGSSWNMINSDGGGNGICNTVVPQNQWNHIAYTRNNTTFRLFLNGKLDGVVSASGSIVDRSSQAKFIGTWAGAGGGAPAVNGSIDDFRFTKGIARYTTDFTPSARALPETGGKSFTTVNINAGVVKTFTLDNLNIVGAKIYHVTTAPRSANYTVQYSDDNANWTTAFGGVMSSMDGTVGIKVGTVTSGGSGTTGTGAWGPHLYWRYVEGSAISGHHPRCSRIIFTDSMGRDFNFKVFVTDNSSDIGEYQLGTKSGIAQSPTINTSWTAPTDVTSVEVLVVAGGGGGGGDQAGGGGGAGGVIYNNAYPVTPGQTYTVTVGAGGAGNGTRGSSSSNYFFGATGGNSQFGNLISLGGGGGASMVVAGSAADSYGAGKPGGSGGGAANWQSTNTGAGGTGTAGQGFNGGSSTVSSGNGHIGGGGGGGGGAGGNATNPNPGTAGPGLSFGILGTPYYFAGGGGGGCYYVTAAAGGIGGGGGGASNISTSSAGGGSALNSGGGGVSNVAGGAGGANTGGGGGGAGGTGGAGGSGIVVIRYTTTAVGNTSDATSDNLVDSPTLYGHDTGAGGEVVGNYATLNPISSPPPYGQASPTLANGNLTYVGVSVYTNADGSIAITSGTFFYEVTLAGTVTDAEAYLMGVNSPGGYFKTAGIRGNGANSGITITTGSTFSYVVGDVIGVAFNYDASLLTYFKNGAQQCTATINGGVGTRPMAAWIQSGGNASVVFHCNFGQRAWAYAPPQGYNALTTKNLPRLTNAASIAPNQYFDAVTYTGTGAAQTITLPGGFQPDLVWVKCRSNINSNILVDSVRGVANNLYSDLTSAEATVANRVTSFNSNGFTLGVDTAQGVNFSGQTQVAWCWQAGGSPVTNTAGTITSQVSANTTSGFSIVTYTGGATGATVGHGLGVTPAFVITKCRNTTQYWIVHHQSLAITSNLYLQTSDGVQPDSQYTAKSATTLTLGASNSSVNTTGNTYVSYCWAEVLGFSKFGSYTGNGSTDGPFIYTGFKPKFVMVKCSSSIFRWIIWDTSRDPVNLATRGLSPNLDSAEITGFDADILSNGFKLRDLEGTLNGSGSTYIYIAFADKPFGNVNGTAR